MTSTLRCRIVLLNGDTLELQLKPKQKTSDLLELANRQCEIPKTAISQFALAFVNNCQHVVWLSSEDRPYQTPIPKDADGDLIFYHFIRFFPNSVLQTTDPITLLHYFYDARMQFLKGYLSQDLEDFVECCAAIIILCNEEAVLNHEEISDIFNEQICPSVKLLRTFHPSLDDIIQQIDDRVQCLRTQSRGSLIIHFLLYSERSPSFGCVFYNVMDGSGHKLLMALNSRSIIVYDPENIYQPKRVFAFSHMDNIFCKDNILTVQVRGRRSLDSVSGVHLNGAQTLPSRSLQNCNFSFSNAVECKMIWSAAVSQHRFYSTELVSCNVEVNSEHIKLVSNSLDELLTSAAERFASIPSTSSFGSYASTSRSSMPAARVADGSQSAITLSKPSIQIPERTPEEKERDAAEYKRLKTNLKDIEDELIENLNELKRLCIAEANITGEIPKEIYMTLLPGETVPHVTKRVGTSFKIDDDVLENSKAPDRIDQLQADIQLHRKIVQAAERLANDKTTNKSVRKKRRKDYQAAAMKLRGLERGLSQLRMSASRPDVTDLEPLNGFSRSRAGSGFSLNSLKHWPNFLGSRTPKSCPATPRGSIPDLTTAIYHHNTGNTKKSKALSRPPRSDNWHPAAVASTSGAMLPPAIPARRPTVSSLGGSVSTDSSSAGRHSVTSTSSFVEPPTYTNVGYRTSAPYKSAYRQSNFPTLQEQQMPMQRSRSVSNYYSQQCNPSTSSIDTQFSIQKADSACYLARRMRIQPSSPRNSPYTSDQLSAIVDHMNSTAKELRKSKSSNFAANTVRSQSQKPPAAAVEEFDDLGYPTEPALSQRSSGVDEVDLAAGFSTSSLDRRAVKTRANVSNTDSQMRDSVSSGVSSASSSTSPSSISRTTTFPVNSEFSYSPSFSPTTRRSPIPQRQRIGISVSQSRVQPTPPSRPPVVSSSHIQPLLKPNSFTQIDPRMEHLLASIHSRAPVQLQPSSLSKRALIVTSPSGQRSNGTPKKTATMV